MIVYSTIQNATTKGMFTNQDLKCLRESAVGLGVRAKIPQMWEHPLNVKIGIAGTD